MLFIFMCMMFGFFPFLMRRCVCKLLLKNNTYVNFNSIFKNHTTIHQHFQNAISYLNWRKMLFYSLFIYQYIILVPCGYKQWLAGSARKLQIQGSLLDFDKIIQLFITLVSIKSGQTMLCNRTMGFLRQTFHLIDACAV